jgi:O-antigen ligase
LNLQSTAALTTGQRQATMGLALAFCVLLLLPWGRTADVPLVLGALWALLLLRQYPRVPALLLVGVLAAAYTLPALLSCIDAVAATKSWSTALGSVRFGLFAAAMVLLLGGHPRTQAALQALIAALVGLWVLDALMQALTGWSLGGFLQADRVSGVFGADDLKLGPVLAVLSPFVLLVVRARLGRVAMASAWLLLAAAVLLAGARAGWVSFGLVSAVLLWRESRRPLRFAGVLASAALLALALGFAAYRGSPTFAERVDRTMAAAAGDRASLDFALAGRLPIWDTAWAMALAHPVNGVGVRGFRHAYASYAAPDDPWLLPRNGGAALHPHQLLLELAAETGLPGLLSWLAGAWWACRAWRRAGPAARERALAPGLALLAMTFPLNTHFAFYSSFWGLLFWWLLALYAAALADEARVAP